ncbi:hypothetical protein C7999DRAFT_32893 [Corynascus novoguineensis]|uniref:Xylanolytic transcriptional activator regulatory domain-containing protein n=1 Tax=Corynascus novoguineensis TaxID=1126955 RepID=A0AAN7CRS3_9PEZI|nr:hypothetical protein C7999DRAFT_32893 [Corynascus novoguineensis]
MCKRRGSACVSQELPDTSQTALISAEANGNQAGIRDRLDRIEALVRTLVQQVARDVDGSPSASSVPGHASSLGRELADGQFRPMLDSDNNIGQIRFGDSLPLSRPLTPVTSVTWTPNPRAVEGAMYDDISRRLSAAWPCQRELDLFSRLRDRACEAFVLKTAGMSHPSAASLHNILQPPPPTSHPVLMAQRLLLLGIALQTIATGCFSGELSALRCSLNDMAFRAVEAAALVTGNDELTGSIQGVECIMTEGLYHDLAGNMRRSWIAVRRATTIAQVMGLHRGATTMADSPTATPSSSRSPSPEPPGPQPEGQTLGDPKLIWLRLVQADRYTSLMLDLPQGALDDIFATPSALEGCTPIEKMRRLDCLAAGRIMRRTPAEMRHRQTTHSIDELLQAAASCMPPQWWLAPDDVTAARGDSVEDDAATTWTAALLDQFVHFHLLARLHLPYLLLHRSQLNKNNGREEDENEHEHEYNDHVYSQMTALTATRDMLARYLAFRRLNPTASYCRGMDLFAFIGATVLCVAHIRRWCYSGSRESLGSSSSSSGGGGGGGGNSSVGNKGNYYHHHYHPDHLALPLLAHQRPSDRALVERTLTHIRHVAHVTGSASAFRMAAVLNRLLAVEEDAPSATCQGIRCRVDCSPSSPGGRTRAGVVDVGKVVNIGDGGIRIYINISYLGTIEVERREQQQVAAVEDPGMTEAETEHPGREELSGSEIVEQTEDWALHGVNVGLEDFIERLDGPGAAHQEEHWDDWLSNGPLS